MTLLTMPSYTKERAKPLHLNEDQMEDLAKHCIRERSVELNQDGTFKLDEKGQVIFRVSPSRLAKEVSGIIKADAGYHQVVKAVNWFARGSKRFKTTIVVPAQASVEEGRLKARITALEAELEKLKMAIAYRDTQLSAQAAKIKQVKETLK